MGMTRMLVEGGIDVVTAEGAPSAIVDHARRLAPDAVVLALADDAQELGEEIRTAAPETKLILWAQDDSEMQVFDSGSARPRRFYNGARHALLTELISQNAREQESL